jgi:beta-glucosidase
MYDLQQTCSRKIMLLFRCCRCLLLSLVLSTALLASAQRKPQQDSSHPWMNRSLSPDERAAMVVKEMSLDERSRCCMGLDIRGLGR